MFRKLIPALNAEESNILKNYMKAQACQEGELIVKKGEDDKDIYFIISGHCEIYQQHLIDNQKTTYQVASLEAPLLLGEFNLFLDYERQASVLATQECKYFLLASEDLEKLKTEHPQIAIKILEHAGKVVTLRLCKLQENLYKNIMKDSSTPALALNKINKYIGKTKICPHQLANKLF